MALIDISIPESIVILSRASMLVILLSLIDKYFNPFNDDRAVISEILFPCRDNCCKLKGINFSGVISVI